MKKKFLIFILTLTFLTNYSQIKFEPGYYLTKNGEKINGLIKNVDWVNNPKTFEFKLNETSETKILSVNEVSEFKINNASHFFSFLVKIDRSSNELNKISSRLKPNFSNEKLFLKMLVDGKAKLYEYTDGNLIRYFFENDKKSINQLVYKTFKFESQIKENNLYKQQLLLNLDCSNFSKDKINHISYSKNDLVKLFIDYSNCHNENKIEVQSKKKRKSFNLTIVSGLRLASINVNNTTFNNRTANFKNTLSLAVGIEGEFILPFNKNKWTIPLASSFQRFSSEIENNLRNDIATYMSLEMSVGLRHYLFLTDNSKLFFNGAILFDFPTNSSINLSSGGKLDITGGDNLSLGIGFKINKFRSEIRYQTNRELLNDYSSYTGEYNSWMLVFGYDIL